VCNPPPSPTPASPGTPPLPPALPSPLEGAIRVEAKMGGDGSTSGGCWQQQQQNARYLTATLPAAGRLLPPLRSVTFRLLELYHECVDNGGWARVLYDAHGGLEKLTIIRRIPPDPTIAAPTKKCKPGHQASDRRQTWD
jgi:hypothetical protein